MPCFLLILISSPPNSWPDLLGQVNLPPSFFSLFTCTILCKVKHVITFINNNTNDNHRHNHFPKCWWFWLSSLACPLLCTYWKLSSEHHPWWVIYLPSLPLPCSVLSFSDTNTFHQALWPVPGMKWPQVFYFPWRVFSGQLMGIIWACGRGNSILDHVTTFLFWKLAFIFILGNHWDSLNSWHKNIYIWSYL